MDLMKQCERWNENDEYQKIVDAIEALPQEERTPELDSELGRAYNNLAGVEDRELYRKAIAALRPHEEYFAEDHKWNFRMGFAYYYLDQEGPALHYFQQALEARPGDEDTQEFIDDCQRRLTLPRFKKNFRERAAEAWRAFQAEEAELRALLDQKDRDGAAAELVAKCSGILSAALENPAFELGFNGEKYELILTPEGDRVKLFELVYFRRQAPAEVLERWNILVGRQPFRGGALRIYGEDISAGDVRVRVEPKGEGERPTGVDLTLYCEKLLPMLREREQNAWLLLSILTDQVLGEIPAMAVINGFQVADAPLEGPDMALTELPGALEGMGLKLERDAAAYLDNGYSTYQMEPNKDPDADWRLDVYAGSTRCPVLVNEYLRGESAAMDRLHEDGAAAGFFCYPLDGFAGGDRAAAVLDFRDALEAAVEEKAGAQCVSFLGGASGVYCGYLDFIAWDLPAVLDAAAEFFAGSPLAWASFHTFRRDVSTVRLWDRDGEIQEDQEEDGPGFDPELYTEEEMAAVEAHIEAHFGTIENVWHELLSPDLHVDVCLIPPTEEREYHTLVTMGMGAHRMDVPEELAEYKLERAELAIALPPEWKLGEEGEEWYWPVRLLKVLARLPGECDTWLGWGHTADNQEPYAENTALCGALLVGPQDAAEGAETCTLPGGEEVNFYQVIPLYRDEMEYKQAHNAEALLDKLAGVSFIVDPQRPDVMA